MTSLSLSLKLSAIKTLSAVQRAINILKSAGPGAWYDPSDLATLFQDSAGTTPVTAVEQPVGLMLDKSGGGNHLIQPTATSRPTLSSRYNLLTKTEAFDDAAWSKTPSGTGLAPVVTQNVALAPDGTMTADRVVFDRGAGNTSSDFSWIAQLPTMLSGASYAAAIWLKADTAGDVGKTVAFRSADNANNIVTLTADWQRVGVTVANAGGSTGVYNRGTFTTGNSVSVQMWGASLVPASDASLPYQRVNTATDYDFDFAKFPAYLKFDGVDDSLYTSAIDFTSTDKMTVFAGVHKASDAATAALVELSANASSTNGAFVLGAPFGTGTATYDQYVRGTAVSGVALGSTPAPTTNVITAVGDIAGDLNRVTKNGTTSNQIGGDLGTGNFGNYPLYIGRRNNASLPFNGRLYQLAIKGKSLSAGEVSTVESYINSKTKAF